MGVRGEIFSSRVLLPNRTYFFNVKENRMGDIYLNIVESKNRETGGFDRQSVVLFADDLQEFLKGFDESLRVLEKTVREKRRSGGSDSRRGEKTEYTERKPYQRPSGEKPQQRHYGEKPHQRPSEEKPHQRSYGEKPRQRPSGERPRQNSTGNRRDRRVVVRKHDR
jgi:hypothetical protein